MKCMIGGLITKPEHTAELFSATKLVGKLQLK